MYIAIVVVAYNRPGSLARLLFSLANAIYQGGHQITLIVSIDKSDDDSCYTIAQEFYWNFGEKVIIKHEINLGLRRHVISCGDLSQKYDAVIILEDDIFVSPAYFDYVIQAINFFGNDETIAGISLYSYRYNECAQLPFEAINDGYDNYFMQVPSSWGQVWTKKQWKSFNSFLEFTNKEHNYSILPENVQKWPSLTSWKKLFYLYLVLNNKYFVYPKDSFSTNFGDRGQHYKSETNLLQVPLPISLKQHRFASLANSLSIYDAYYEIEGRCLKHSLPAYCNDLECDLNGVKPISKITKKYLISTKQVSLPIQTFAVGLLPPELNVFFGLHDKDFKNYYALACADAFSDNLNNFAVDIHKRRITNIILADILRSEKVKVQYEIFNSKEYKLGSFVLDSFRKVKSIFKW